MAPFSQYFPLSNFTLQDPTHRHKLCKWQPVKDSPLTPSQTWTSFLCSNKFGYPYLKVVLPNFLHKNPQWTPPPLFTTQANIHTYKSKFHAIMLTLFHSLKKAQPSWKYQHQKVFLFLWLIPHFFSFPTTDVSDTWNKQKVEWHRAKFSSARWFLLYWCASYLPRTMLIPSIYPPKKEGTERKGACLGS